MEKKIWIQPELMLISTNRILSKFRTIVHEGTGTTVVYSHSKNFMTHGKLQGIGLTVSGVTIGNKSSVLS